MRKTLCAVLLTLTASATVLAEHQAVRISRVSSTDQRLNVQIENARLSAVVRALQIHLPKPVMLESGADRRVTIRAFAITAEALLRAIVANEKLRLESRGDWWIIGDPSEPTVSLDVKDVEITAILQIMKEQCGIRNVMIDPGVAQQKGTFLFSDVPCTTAFKVVFASLGLSAEFYPNSVVTIETRQ